MCDFGILQLFPMTNQITDDRRPYSTTTLINLHNISMGGKAMTDESKLRI